MRILIGALAMALLVGCSTSPVTEQTAKTIPSERVYHPEMLATRSGVESAATVVFLRDSGMFGSGCSHDMFVNNVKVFSIRQGEFAKLYLDPGSYFFRLETGGGICPNIATSQSSELKPGANEAYRILLPSDGSLRLTRIQ
ncbi:hypothetical protein WLF14_14330 [Pseudomonas fluorescens]|uniref:Lipoprotein n=1 Tax=Pseudomonas fluorescens TaxID=294 RepID=A0A7M2JGJ1_PSEFL|nr:hypothetical protein [Pseudomonas fluorescens]QOU08060.1 hypothetical protein IM720_15475 [Pseudomonas fluorescens]